MTEKSKPSSLNDIREFILDWLPSDASGDEFKASLICRLDALSSVAKPCTCHPDDSPPQPCAKQYALSACRSAARELEWEDAKDRGYSQANCVLGQYQVTWLGEFECWQCGRPHRAGLDWKDNFSRHPTKDEAKAAAQADYETRILSALISSPGKDGGQPVTLTYTNWRGETAERSIKPLHVWFGSTDWHPEPQWLLKAIDCEKNAERDFALKDFGGKDGGKEVEAVAKRIYEAMRVAAHAHESDRKTPEWVERGNSLMQEEARRVARSIASQAQPDSTALVERLKERISVFRGMAPEEGETWESWYFAAFDLLTAEIAALSSLSTSREQ